MSSESSPQQQWTSSVEGDAKVFEIFQGNAASVFRRADSMSLQIAVLELCFLGMFLVALGRFSGAHYVLRPAIEQVVGLGAILMLFLCIGVGVYWVERTERERFVVRGDTMTVYRYQSRSSAQVENRKNGYATIKGDESDDFFLYLSPETSRWRHIRPSYIYLRYKSTEKLFGSHLSHDELKEAYTGMCEALGRTPDIRRAKIAWSWVIGFAMGWVGFLMTLSVIALVIFD